MSSRPDSPASPFECGVRPVSPGPSTKGGCADTGAHLGGAVLFGLAAGCTTASGSGGGVDFLQATSDIANVSGTSTQRMVAFVAARVRGRKVLLLAARRVSP